MAGRPCSLNSRFRCHEKRGLVSERCRHHWKEKGVEQLLGDPFTNPHSFKSVDARARAVPECLDKPDLCLLIGLLDQGCHDGPCRSSSQSLDALYHNWRQLVCCFPLPPWPEASEPLLMSRLSSHMSLRHNASLISWRCMSAISGRKGLHVCLHILLFICGYLPDSAKSLSGLVILANFNLNRLALSFRDLKEKIGLAAWLSMQKTHYGIYAFTY
ncbi:hypothetical protein B0H67DRAFT_586805 [Lasiosphaeris hirsuta]|uniref:Uncharacterized protein n=1 Tax=Lasiosphaeris hirsuta TaxID=260670 RepID=A0AA40DST2_9PEZI|nr:hypothetical protein B0H67DRAFT_586805 [Lasiosphaeris hirsuta]